MLWLFFFHVPSIPVPKEHPHKMLTPIPAELLRTLTPIETRVLKTITAGGDRTMQSLADELSITMDELSAVWASAQEKYKVFVESDIGTACVFIGYKPDASGKLVPRSRAERIAMFEQGIAKAGSARGNSLTAVQLDAMLFPTTAPNMDMN